MAALPAGTKRDALRLQQLRQEVGPLALEPASHGFGLQLVAPVLALVTTGLGIGPATDNDPVDHVEEALHEDDVD